MLRRYELTDEEWSRITHLFPLENPSKRGRPRKDNRMMLNAMVWLARSGAPWRDLPARYGPWETVYSRFRKWIDDGILDNVFRILSMEAELDELFMDGSIVQAHQHCIHRCDEIASPEDWGSSAKFRGDPHSKTNILGV